MSIIDNKNINPEMKFVAAKKTVIKPPKEVYCYSVHDEMLKSDYNYNQIMRSINKRQKLILSEKHPDIINSIKGFMKITSAIIACFAGVRYRHSIPFIKDLCKKPKNTPPNFMDDLSRLWQSIVKK